MQILLACAKDMKPVSHATPTVKTVPLFQQEAEANALEMMKYSAEELAEMMKTNRQIGAPASPTSTCGQRISARTTSLLRKNICGSHRSCTDYCDRSTVLKTIDWRDT